MFGAFVLFIFFEGKKTFFYTFDCINLIQMTVSMQRNWRRCKHCQKEILCHPSSDIRCAPDRVLLH